MAAVKSDYREQMNSLKEVLEKKEISTDSVLHKIRKKYEEVHKQKDEISKRYDEELQRYKNVVELTNLYKCKCDELEKQVRLW